ncbi:hypothetical protein H0H87_000193 [Tephrocybe sp. NHM501043]|nr:hypothetical protein H0H87_000193 [Tephrocybe sp. NHM501043]
MAPARSSIRHPDQNNTQRPSLNAQNIDLDVNPELFLDPMLGTPLAMYIEKDVDDKDVLIDLIPKYGGSICPGYSGVPYILVDPHKASGQNLWRQYAGKKGKIVLNSQWVHECIKANALQTFHTNWAGCKVTGSEVVTPVPEPPPQTQPVPPTSNPNVIETRSSTRKRTRPNESVDSVSRQVQAAPPPPHPHPQHPMHPQVMTPMTVSSLVEAHNNYNPYHTVYDPAAAMHQPRPMQPAPAPPQTWQASGAIAPQQTRLDQPPMASLMPPTQYTDEGWERYGQPSHPADPMAAPPGMYYRYRDDQAPWAAGAHTYYDASAYEQAYQQPYIEEQPPADTNATAGPSTAPPEPTEKRGRKRTRTQVSVPPPATPATVLVANKNPPARSPTPPSRVIKSTYGGNLFTSDDVLYLKKYIDYCQEQGLVLSLREICERIAVKAPHHTSHSFYSWRRYCNKHQIRLGGYVMNIERPDSPMMDEDQEIEEEAGNGIIHSGPGGPITTPSQRTDPPLTRNKSPTPPRALYRSTTGKGVAFTEEDVSFLRRFMEYRKYLLVPGFLDIEQTDALLGRAKQLLAEFSLDDHPLTKFTTSDKNHVGDDYFLNSGDKIRYFLEEDVVDEHGKLTREKSKAVNKIGHALHELDPAFRKVTLENEKLKSLVKDLKFHRDPVGKPQVDELQPAL